VIGIWGGSPTEISSYGSTRKNAVAIIEGILHRDMTLE